MSRTRTGIKAFLQERSSSWSPALALAIALVALSGCGVARRETFDLRTAAIPRKTQLSTPKSSASVSIAEPRAEQLLNTNRLVIREEAGNLAYLADAQWTDRAPRLIQGRLVARLVREGVDAAFPGSEAAYRLATDLRRFEIDASKGVAIVEIAARISSDQSGALRGEAVFVGEAPAPRTIGPDAARAFDEALDQAAGQLAVWTRKRI